jgi:metal-responsive CopG/Arc/MetJ family transcriptional regulator
MRTHVILPDELVEDIDNLVGKRNRSKFIAAAAESRLRAEEKLAAVRRAAGSIDLREYPEWSSPEKVSEWVRAQRRVPSSYEKRSGKVSAGHQRPD